MNFFLSIIVAGYIVIILFCLIVGIIRLVAQEPPESSESQNDLKDKN